MARSRNETDLSVGDEVAERVRAAVAAAGEGRPLYVRIALALASEMTSGRIPSGERLPSQRQLAMALGVNLTTVTRAMSYLKDRGLILPEVGRGTAVRGRTLDQLASPDDHDLGTPTIDLTVLRLDSPRYDAFVREALPEIARDPGLAGLREYHPALGSPGMREAASRWFAECDVPSSPDRIAVTSGAQHALVVTLSTVARPGDVVLAPKLVYRGLKGAARMLGLGLVPVETDDDGMLPQSVEEQASRSRTRALFVVPTLDNPTGSTLPVDRRREIAAMARRSSLAIIEDDVFRPLSPEPAASFASLYPEGTFHISSTSKVIAPGCRCGFLTFPAPFQGAVAASLRGSIWMADQLSVALVQRLIESGLHREIIAELGQELARRHVSAERALGSSLAPSAPWSNTIWVRLGAGLRSAQAVAALQADGVGVHGSETFAIGPPGRDDGIRIYKSSAVSTDEWERALALVARHVRSAAPDTEAA